MFRKEYIMRIITLTVFTSFLIFFSCSLADTKTKKDSDDKSIRIVREYSSSSNLKAEISVKGKVRHGITKNYNKHGILLSKVNYVDGKKEGKTINYYTTGKVHSTIMYKNNRKNGYAVWYYENGKPYSINPFVNNKLNGIKKKYHENGKLFAEIPYKDEYPGIGLKEYTAEGKLITDYPKIIVEEINQIKFNNKYILKIYLSNRSRSAKFYIDDLYDGKYLRNYVYEIPAQQGVATRIYEVPPGYAKFEKINIIAKVNTRLGNPYITQRTYNLAIKH